MPPFTSTCIQPNANSGETGKPSLGAGVAAGSSAFFTLSATFHAKSSITIHAAKRFIMCVSCFQAAKRRGILALLRMRKQGSPALPRRLADAGSLKHHYNSVFFIF